VRDGFTNIVAGNYHRLPTQTRKLRRIDSLKERLLKQFGLLQAKLAFFISGQI